MKDLQTAVRCLRQAEKMLNRASFHLTFANPPRQRHSERAAELIYAVCVLRERVERLAKRKGSA